MYISDSTIKWDKNELFIAENQNFDNTGKLIVHFTDNRFLNIELAEYYPQVKRIFFQYKEGEILLSIEKLNLNNIVFEKPVFIERIVSFKIIKGFLKIIMDTVLSFFKSCSFHAVCSKSDKAKMKDNEKIMHIINDNPNYRNIWKEKGFNWVGVIY